MAETNCVGGLEEHVLSADEEISSCIFCGKDEEDLEGNISQSGA